MTEREKEIFNIIKKNPGVEQKHIANELGITRSSVAVHIANLIKKGYLLGKGYVINDRPYVLGIGGANVDIQGFSNDKIVYEDSNPGEVIASSGGVCRNICENLSRLGVETKLVSAIGDDYFGKKLFQECVEAGINVENVIKSEKAQTSCYLSIIDSDGDMKVAISHMDVMKEITVEKIKKLKGLIEKACIIIIDTNLEENVIEYILSNYNEKIIFVDTVSTKKSVKIKKMLKFIDTLKPNIYEAQMLSGVEIKDDKGLEKAAVKIIEKGIKNLFISMGEKGIFYMDEQFNSKLYKPEKVNMINATGAGDSFMAGLIYGRFNDFSVDDTVKFAMSLAAYTVESEETINKNISEEKVLLRMRGNLK